MRGFHDAAILMQIKEIRKSGDMNEVAKMLSSGKWIAFYATTAGEYCISLGRIAD